MSSDEKMYTLKSSDGEIFTVEEAVAKQFQTIKQMIENECDNSVIPLPNVTSKIFVKVIEYCKEHVKDSEVKKPASSSVDPFHRCEINESLKAWDAQFIINLDYNLLIEIILAANYLNIKNLLDLASQAIADRIKDKTVEEIRDLFGILNDFTPEEEAAIRNENLWAYS